MVDITTEKLFQFHHARELIPGRPAIQTLHRWRLRGIRGHKLETILIGGKRFTSIEAIERFSAALSGQADDSLKPRTPKQRQRAHENALAELAAP
jgi:hypothetical protein